VVECAGLEIRYTVTPYRGFESLPFRQVCAIFWRRAPAQGIRQRADVPIAEHIRTHQGSVETVRRLAAEYANDPRVSVRVVDNTQGKGGPSRGRWPGLTPCTTMTSSSASVLHWSANMKQVVSQPRPTKDSPAGQTPQDSRAGRTPRTPEVQQMLDEFHREIGGAMVKALNKSVLDKAALKK
jgi:hypothetical protein